MNTRPSYSSNGRVPPPASRPPRRVRGGGIGAYVGGCLLLLLGICIGIAGVIVAFFLFVGQTASNQPIVHTDPNAPYDVKVDLSQKYLNDEVSTALVKNPPVIPLVTVKQILLELQDNDQIKVTARLNGLGRDIDLAITDLVGTDGNGNIELRQVGKATLANFLQIDTTSIVNVINTTIISAQLNQSIKSMTVQGRQVKLTSIAVRSGFVTVGVNIVR